MKTKKNLYLCAALALVLLASLFGIGRSHYGAVNAEENTEGVFLKISSTNLSFDDNIYIYFRAYYDGIDVSDASSDNYGMIFWKTEVAEAERTFENAQTLAASGSAIIIEKCDDWQNLPINAQGDKKNVATYKYKVAAKEMADVIYAEPYTLKGGVYYYGKTIEYSVAAYASRRLGFYHGVAGSTNENFINLLNAMVNYGTLAQKYFNYNVDNLMSDVVSAGKHATLTHIEALAPTCTEAGHAEYWKCECGQLFADADGKTTLEAIPTLDPLGHDLVTDTCTHCTRCNYRKPSDGLVYTLNADGASYSVTGIGTATDTFIVIAPEYNSLPVTAIGANAFYNQSQVIGVETPASIDSVGQNAFYNCNLGEIDFKGTLMQWLTFDSSDYPSLKLFTQGNLWINNNLLSDITTPDSINKIRPFAFYNCINLNSITLSNNVKSIGTSAFQGCSNLISVNLSSNLKEINFQAFMMCGKLKEIIMPNTLDFLGGASFSQCSNLQNVVLSNKLAVINGATFQQCSNIKSIIIPDSISEIRQYAFYYCFKLRNLIFGKNITTIEQNAFNSCHLSSSFSLPNKLTEIGANAFTGCDGITILNIPNSVKTIKSGAFYGCSGITELTLSNNICDIEANTFYGCSAITNLSIPYGVTHIGSQAFKYCIKLTNITIPSTLTSIDKDAFYNCYGLKSVNYMGNIDSWCKIKFYDHTSTPLYYGGKLLINGEEVKNIIIPETVAEINGSLCCCNSISSVTILGGLTSIGNYMFYKCSNLTTVIIADSITSIGYSAFYGCNNLTKIDFNGTMSEWKAITKENGWNSSTGNYTVDCTDGKLDKNDNEITD